MSDYLDNKQFSIDVWEYVQHKNNELEAGRDCPRVPNNIAEGLSLIAKGLSHKPSFIGYPFREDMVQEAVMRCLKAISNYNPEVETRIGVPNAFSYFTQVCYYDFLRTIRKEKTYMYNYYKILSKSSLEDLVNSEDDSHDGEMADFIDYLKKDVESFLTDFENNERKRKEKQMAKNKDTVKKGFDKL